MSQFDGVIRDNSRKRLCLSQYFVVFNTCCTMKYPPSQIACTVAGKQETENQHEYQVSFETGN